MFVLEQNDSQMANKTKHQVAADFGRLVQAVNRDIKKGYLTVGADGMIVNDRLYKIRKKQIQLLDEQDSLVKANK